MQHFTNYRIVQIERTGFQAGSNFILPPQMIHVGFKLCKLIIYRKKWGKNIDQVRNDGNYKNIKFLDKGIDWPIENQNKLIYLVKICYGVGGPINR